MPRSQHGLARQIEREQLRDPRIAEAFRAVDRADFVPEDERADAYRDGPIQIPHDQTTSQPSLIARMLDAAAPGPEDNVLEVGTGLGFQTALLARLAKQVTSVERWPALAEAARRNVAAAGATNVEVVVGDGWQGYPERAPFDAIVVSAAASEVPTALVEQLAEGGRLVIPVREGPSDTVWLLQKRAGGAERVRMVTPARFVPLIQG